MTKHPLLISVFVSGLFLSTVAQAAGKISTEGAAIQIAAKAVAEYKMTPLPKNCILMIRERSDDTKFFDIAVREAHNKVCGGDPDVAPIIVRLRVKKRDGSVSVFEPIEGYYYPIKEYPAHNSEQ